MSDFGGDGYEPVTFGFNERKARAAIAYIVSREPGIAPIKLAIMLYLADRKHLLTYGCPIIGGTYLATEVGPVLKEACESWLRLDSPWLPHASFRSWRRGVWA